MVKIFDENVLGKLFIIDDKSGLAHHVVAPDFYVTKVSPTEHLVSLKEAHLPHQGWFSVLAAKGKGRLGVGNPSLLELIPAACDPAVDVEEEKSKKEENLNPHFLL